MHLRNLLGSTLAATLTLVALYVLFGRVALHAIEGSATIGDLAIFAGAAGRLRLSLDQFTRSVSATYEQTLLLDNLKKFLLVRPALESGEESPRGESAAAVTIERVSFTYPGTDQPALRDVSLDIAPGETIAIVGENGAGKSTLTKLIARLYDPTTGTIRFNGIDVKDLSTAELRRQIGFVFQTFARYEATAGENIAFGDWETLLEDPGRVRDVSSAAGVDELIENLPQGYDTVLGRRFGDVTLSVGQWQRLAMARAFARGGSLLVLDEPTASLDARTESELFASFKKLADGRTTILVSHRFSTIRMADRIVVLSDGRIVEVGSHDQLVQARGTYAAMYRLHERQFSGA
ncbi:MAG: ABC transporter ATP-binding protein/permease [Gemmatimonadetes bacterium]|nr:ABC transporter ATP-binding protein/permease [Gemmatimonadota bacterium]